MKVAPSMISSLLAFPLIVHVLGKPCKQDICHRSFTDDGIKEWNTLNIACSAVAAHLAHGDFLKQCEVQECSDLCHHASCQNDFEIDQDGKCICVDLGKIECGKGAECNTEMDACVCTDSNQIFDLNGDCIDACIPTGRSYTLDMCFRDDFQRMYVIDGEDKDTVIAELGNDFPALFGLAGTCCNVTITDLDIVELPGKFFTAEKNLGGGVTLCTPTSTKKEVHYGPAYPLVQDGTHFTISAKCENQDSEEYFKSFANERKISYYDQESWKSAASDLNYFQMLTSELDEAIKENDSCDDLDYEPFYNKMNFEFSIAHSGFWGEDPTQSGPDWLPGKVHIYVSLIDPDLMSGEDYLLIHNSNKTTIFDVVPEYNETVSISPIIWQAKLYNSGALDKLNVVGDEFKIYADVNAIEVHVGTDCV